MKADEAINEIITKIKDYIYQSGLSEHELAKLAGVTPSTICHLINGKHVPTLKTIIGICNALEIEWYIL